MVQLWRISPGYSSADKQAPRALARRVPLMKKNKLLIIFPLLLLLILSFFLLAFVGMHDTAGLFLPGYRIDFLRENIPDNTAGMVFVQNISESVSKLKRWKSYDIVKDHPLLKPKLSEESGKKNFIKRFLEKTETETRKGVFRDKAVLLALRGGEKKELSLVFSSMVDLATRTKLLFFVNGKIWFDRGVRAAVFRGEKIASFPSGGGKNIYFCCMRNTVLLEYGKNGSGIREMISIIKDRSAFRESGRFAAMTAGDAEWKTKDLTAWIDCRQLEADVKGLIEESGWKISPDAVFLESLVEEIKKIEWLSFTCEASRMEIKGRSVVAMRDGSDSHALDQLAQASGGRPDMAAFVDEKNLFFWYRKDFSLKDFFFRLREYLNSESGKGFFQSLPLASIKGWNEFHSRMVSVLNESEAESFVSRMGKSAAFFLNRTSEGISPGFIVEYPKGKDNVPGEEKLPAESGSRAVLDWCKKNFQIVYEKGYLMAVQNPGDLEKVRMVFGRADRAKRNPLLSGIREDGILMNIFYCKPYLPVEQARKYIDDLISLDEEENSGADNLQELSNLLFLLKITGVLDLYLFRAFDALQSIDEMLLYSTLNKDFTFTYDFVIIGKNEASLR
jgi:hypothetical protein